MLTLSGLEVDLVSATSAAATIKILRKLFATHGLPDLVFTDNGTAFKSREFSDFLSRNNIKMGHTSTYHPATNGQAERMVQTTKRFLERLTEGDWSVKIARFLLNQHVTPHSETGVAPCELLMGRQLVTALNRLKPKDKTERKEEEVDRKKTRQFKEKDLVYVKNYGRGNIWIKGSIEKVLGTRNYRVKMEDGSILQRHIDQLKTRVVDKK